MRAPLSGGGSQAHAVTGAPEHETPALVGEPFDPRQENFRPPSLDGRVDVHNLYGSFA
jgi:hypothetical protein